MRLPPLLLPKTANFKPQKEGKKLEVTAGSVFFTAGSVFFFEAKTTQQRAKQPIFDPFNYIII